MRSITLELRRELLSIIHHLFSWITDHYGLWFQCRCCDLYIVEMKPTSQPCIPEEYPVQTELMVGDRSVFSFFVSSSGNLQYCEHNEGRVDYCSCDFTAGRTILAGLVSTTFFQIWPSWIEFSGSTSLHRIRSLLLPCCPSLALLTGGFNVHPIFCLTIPYVHVRARGTPLLISQPPKGPTQDYPTQGLPGGPLSPDIKI